MQFDHVTLAYFSPTGTTRAVLRSIAEGLGAATVDHLDLTLPTAGARDLPPLTDTLVVLGAPVYAGRIPETAVERLCSLRGAGTPALLIVVYGNRAFEDALLELAHLARDGDFVPLAGAAFIGEHSFATPETPIAMGRPDAADLARAVAFGQLVRARLAAAPDLAALPRLQVPGNYPYRRGMENSEAAPITDPDLCTLCADCAVVCPVGAITVTDRVTTDGAACILCCACTRACPVNARVMVDAGVRRIARWLATNQAARKEPETFCI